MLRDVILSDPSDYGIDLAVAKVFTSYRPSAQRWNHLQYPDARWLICKTIVFMGQPSQTVHIDLLYGELRVDGQPLNGLPRTKIRNSKQIFHGVRTCAARDVSRCS